MYGAILHNTASRVIIMRQQGKVINIKDILAQMLFKWRIILLAAIIGCVAGAGISVYKTRQYQSALAARQVQIATSKDETAAAEEAETKAEEGVHNGPYDEQMEEARALLTQLEITKVDGLYAQYAANIQLRDTLADNINNSVIMRMDADHAAITRILYTLDTDQDYLANSITTLVMTDDLFEQAAPILGEDVETKYMADLLSVWKGSTGTTGDSIRIYDDDRTTSMIYIQAIAYTEEQADAIADIMGKALESAVEDMRDIDPDIQTVRIGKVATIATSSTINDIQRTLVTELNNVASQITNMKNNEINNLTQDESTYYELLVSEGKGIHVDEPETEETNVAEGIDVEEEALVPPSKVKYVLLGLVGGAVLACVAMILYWLLLDRRLWSLTEIEYETNIPTLAVYERRLLKSKDPVVRAGIQLQTGGKAVEDEAAYQPILAARIEELLVQNGRSSLYLYNEGQLILNGEPGHVAVSGQPESSAEAMEGFLRSDSVILVISMYRTEHSALAGIINLCKVHGKQILGDVVIYEC